MRYGHGTLDGKSVAPLLVSASILQVETPKGNMTEIARKPDLEIQGHLNELCFLSYSSGGQLDLYLACVSV